MRFVQFSLLALLVISAVGCTSRRSRGGGSVDAGVDAMIVLPDSGGITLPDSGGIALPDSGPRGTDAGPIDRCPPQTAPVPSIPGCTATTESCVLACTDNTCFRSCIDADADPTGCQRCLSQAAIHCTTSNGCAEQFGEVVCCAEENCPDYSCLESTCGPETSAYDSCATGVGACGSLGIYDPCFP